MSNRWVCQTPNEYCNGSSSVLAPALGNLRSHSSPEEAFKCYMGYLKSVRGYKQIGSRELAPPDGGPIEVLTKPSRYGARLRPGKEGRFMASIRNSGIIIS